MSKLKLLRRQHKINELCFNPTLEDALKQLTRIQQVINKRKGVNAELSFELKIDEELSCVVYYQSPETATEQKKRLLEEALRKQKKVKDKSEAKEQRKEAKEQRKEAKEQRKQVYLKLKKEFEGM